jgi:hypothetical protein
LSGLPSNLRQKLWEHYQADPSALDNSGKATETTGEQISDVENPQFWQQVAKDAKWRDVVLKGATNKDLLLRESQLTST